MIAHFRQAEVLTDSGAVISAACGGTGPAVLLLHGFPETHVMWRHVAPALADHLTVICADLPGYGGSTTASAASGCPQSKRAVAISLVQAMEQLGFSEFAVVGHDRGGRVAYRMALDHPNRITRLVALDIIPTAAAWDRADARFALSFWPFSLLAQPEPLPEKLIGGCPEAVIDAALSQWGTPAHVFPDDVRVAYIEALRDPVKVHAICDEYRAAASIDREHDHADFRAGRRISCPLLALWSNSGGLASWYDEDGGPLEIWRRWAEDVTGEAVPGGHFFPEEYPAETAARLQSFLDHSVDTTGRRAGC
jgi:haloacetate dehalogenase